MQRRLKNKFQSKHPQSEQLKALQRRTTENIKDKSTSNVVELVIMVLLMVCVIAELRISKVCAVLIDLNFP